MTNAELIQKIRAEIERQMNFYDGKEREVLDDPKQFTYALLYQGHQRMCAKLLSFLSTLEDGDMEIVNDLTSEVPTRAVQLPDGRWVTEAFANNDCSIYGRKPEERHCEYCSANCSTGHDFQRTKGLDEAAKEAATKVYTYTFQGMDDLIGLFKAGAKWDRSQMMKEAIPCKVFWHDGPLLDYTQEQQDNALEKIGATIGDKVRIIIVKEDEK